MHKRAVVQFLNAHRFVAEYVGQLIPGGSTHLDMDMTFLKPAYFPLFFICFWSGVSFLISLIGGWFELGRAYRSVTRFQGSRFNFQNAYLRLMTSYRGIVTVGGNSEGFFASVFLPFRIGHPPLFVPWQDVSVRPDMCLWVRVYEFRFRQVPTVRFRLREKVGKKIQEAAGSAWPGDRSTTGGAF